MKECLPLISVIVPVYKVESYLKDCVKSICGQTYENLEIILVNDGSPDSCPELCDEWRKKDSRIKVVHKTNGGLSSARNAGLEVAKGEYIGFVDGDDTIEPDMYEVLYDAIKNGKRDISICGTKVITTATSLKKNVNVLVSSRVQMSSSELWDEIFGFLNNSACNKLYKRELIEDVRFPEGLCHGEDLLFNILYAGKCESGALVKDLKYNYYKRDNSITTGAFSVRNFDEIIVKDKAKEYIDEMCPRLKDKALLYCFLSRMNVCRKIYKSGKQVEYTDVICEYMDFWKKNYRYVKRLIKIRRKIEFIIFLKMRWVYMKIVNVLGD